MSAGLPERTGARDCRRESVPVFARTFLEASRKSVMDGVNVFWRRQKARPKLKALDYRKKDLDWPQQNCSRTCFKAPSWCKCCFNVLRKGGDMPRSTDLPLIM